MKTKHKLNPMTSDQQLVRACQQGDLKLVVSALRNGACANARERDFTALHWAAQEGYLTIVEILIAHGANVNARNKGGLTPLHQAIGPRRGRIVSLLLKHGADPSAFSKETQSTPLHTCCAYGYLAIARILLKHGANSRVKDGHGRTPLYWAGIYRHKDVSDHIRTARRIQSHEATAQPINSGRGTSCLRKQDRRRRTTRTRYDESVLAESVHGRVCASP